MNAIKIKRNLYIKERVQQLHFIAYLTLCYVSTEQGSFGAQETTASYTNYYSFKISNYLPSAKREINLLYLKAIYSVFFFCFAICAGELCAFCKLYSYRMNVYIKIWPVKCCMCLFMSEWQAHSEWMKRRRKEKKTVHDGNIFIVIHLDCDSEFI